MGREAGHNVLALERVEGDRSPKRRDGAGARRVAEPTGVGLRRPPVGLVLGWGDVAERGVQPLVVEPADPLDDRQLGLLVGAPDAVGDQLGLEAVDERFRERVVITVASLPDTYSAAPPRLLRLAISTPPPAFDDVGSVLL